MLSIKERLENIEKERQDTVESVLSKISVMVNAKDGSYTKDVILDLVLTLKMVATETKHPKAGYFSAVFQSLRGKLDVPDYTFCDYVKCLLGDKDQEKVMDILVQSAFSEVGLAVAVGKNLASSSHIDDDMGFTFS